jgi:cryptochrome 1
MHFCSIKFFDNSFFNHIQWQFEGYKFDPNGEYVRRWIPELARLPTEWIHHPWDAPVSVLQAAGVELGSNYPLPIVELDAANARLQDALTEMWQREAASRATMNNGMEEGLGDSSEIPPIEFPQELQMEVDRQPAQAPTNMLMTAQRLGDQMVPTMTSSLNRAETEVSAGLGNGGDSRAEVPSYAHFEPPAEMEEVVRNTEGDAARINGAHRDIFQQPQHHRRDILAPSVSEASSSWTGREGGVVPVWSPPAASSHLETFVADEADISNRSYLDRHPQSHQMMNWSQLWQSL